MVQAEDCTITNQSGETVSINGVDVIDNSAKPVGSMAGSDAYLASLKLGSAYLQSDFGNLQEAYTAEVAYHMENTAVTAVPSQEEATVAVNGQAADKGNGYTVTVPLQEGENTGAVTVTAPDQTTKKNYVITISKQPQPDPVKIRNGDPLQITRT